MKADYPLLASENGMEMWSYEDLMMQNKLKSKLKPNPVIANSKEMTIFAVQSAVKGNWLPVLLNTPPPNIAVKQW